MRAMARAEVLPPAGMSAARVSGRLPKSALGNSSSGAGLEHRQVGRHRGQHLGGRSAAPGSSSSGASRWCSEAGMPNHSSSATPSGPATSSAQDLGDRLAGGAADDLPDDVAEGVGVVADLGAGLPPQLGVGDGGAHLVPVAEVLDGGVQRDARHPGGVVEDLAHGHGLLAVGGELRPQLGDRRVVAEQAALGQDVGHGRGRALDDREVVEQRAGVDRAAAGRVGDAGHGVDHLLAVAVDGDLDAPLGPGLDQLVDRLLHLLLSSSMRVSFVARGQPPHADPARPGRRATRPITAGSMPRPRRSPTRPPRRSGATDSSRPPEVWASWSRVATTGGRPGSSSTWSRR